MTQLIVRQYFIIYHKIINAAVPAAAVAMATKALPGFQQFGAQAHTARVTVEYLHQLGHTMKPEFISPDLWPPNRPDLSSVERV